MADHPLVLVYAARAAIVTALVAAIATRVQLLTDAIAFALIPTGSGLGSLTYGALRRVDPERIGRMSLLGTLVGGFVTAGALVIAVVADALSPKDDVAHVAPYLVVAMLVMGGAGLIYGLGGPAWIMYAAIVPAVLSVIPGYERWERHQHPR